jgi:hypothetical protein
MLMVSRIQALPLAFALFTIIFNSSALTAAEGDQYFGLQYASTTFEIDGLGEDWEPAVLTGRYGKYLSDNFSLEGRLGIGAGDDTINFSGPGGSIDIEVEIDTLFGIYGVGHHAINNNSSVYALIGLSRGEATMTGTGFLVATGPFNETESDTETDLSYGVGANIGINNTTGINLEYISYLSKNDFDVSALNFGFVFKF